MYIYIYVCVCVCVLNGLPYYLPIAGGRIVGCISFPKVLVQSEM